MTKLTQSQIAELINVHSILEELPDFETADALEDEAYIRISSLRQSKLPNRVGVRTALEHCYEDEPCNSPACPMCVSRNRLQLIESVLRLCFYAKPFFYFITIVYFSDELRCDNPKAVNPQTLMNRLRKQLTKAGFTRPVIGTFELDYDLRTHTWIPHFHLIADGVTLDQIERLKELVKVNNSGDRMGVRMKPFDSRLVYDIHGLVPYMNKFMIQAKIAKSTPESRPRKVRLPEKQFVYSLIWLHQFKFKDLEFRYKVTRSKNGLNAKCHSMD